MMNCRRYMGIGVLVGGLLLPAAHASGETPATLQDGYQRAAAAAQRGDYVIAYCFWRPLAEQGDAEAQYALGWMYHNGYGLVSNDQSARMWWEKAIAQGHVEAMFSLGTLYSVGSNSIARNNVAAMKLWARAAEAGNVHAQFALRELVQRDLPELRSLTLMIRAQYPHLLGVLPDAAQGTGVSFKQVDDGAADEAATAQRLYRNGSWLAVAAGYPPELGWAAAHLLQSRQRYVRRAYQLALFNSY